MVNMTIKKCKIKHYITWIAKTKIGSTIKKKHNYSMLYIHYQISVIPLTLLSFSSKPFYEWINIPLIYLSLQQSASWLLIWWLLSLFCTYTVLYSFHRIFMCTFSLESHLNLWHFGAGIFISLIKKWGQVTYSGYSWYQCYVLLT